MSHADDPVHGVVGPQGAAVVSMPGQIDRANCARVHAALMQAVDSGAGVIVADLTRTDFCGDAATVTLVSAHDLAAQAGSRLRVAAARPNARLIGQIAGTVTGWTCTRT